MAKVHSSSRVRPDWFEMVYGPWWLIIMPNVFMVLALFHQPDVVPYEYLGPYGTLCKYLVEVKPGVLANIYYFMTIVHSCEALYTLFLCRKLSLNSTATFKWTLQTFLMGITSLHMIVRKSKQKKA